MGTSGNRKGYKIFSISTTLRNPYRNEEFLVALKETFLVFSMNFEKCNWNKYNDAFLNEFYKTIISKGIYKPSKVDNSIKIKWKNNEILNEKEVNKIISDNPQKTDPKGGGINRVKTHLRALKYQNLIMLDEKEKKLGFTKLGWELIYGLNNDNDVFIKAFIKLQYGGILRKTSFNKSIPFLSLIHVLYNFSNNHFQKISKYQFMVILMMKDCNWNEALSEIKKMQLLKPLQQQNYIFQKMKKENYKKLDEKSLEEDYIDEVCRKFERTGLFEINAQKYIGLAKLNFFKTETILNLSRNFKFIDFNSLEDYYYDLNNFSLPWEINVESKKSLILAKAKYLNISYDSKINFKKIEEQIRQKENRNNFEIIANSINLEYVIDILVKINDEKHVIKSKPEIEIDKLIFDSIQNFVKFEWFTAILLYKISDDYSVRPNSNFDYNGYPKFSASGNKADLIIESENMTGIIELTTIKNKNQQMNSETTSIARHLAEEYQDNQIEKRLFSLLIAPILHPDVINFFNYQSREEQQNGSNVILTGAPSLYFLNWIVDTCLRKKMKLSSTKIINFVEKEFSDYQLPLKQLNKVLSPKNLTKFITN